MKTMIYITRINAVASAAIAAAMAVVSCTKEETGQPALPEIETCVTVGVAGYDAVGGDASHEEHDELSGLRACLFEGGELKGVYEPEESADGPLFRLTDAKGTLYVLSETDRIGDFGALCATGTPEREWLTMTADAESGIPVGFMSGSTVLTGEADSHVTLTRGVARIDLRIRTVGSAAVGQLTFRGAALRTGVFATSDAASRDRGDIVFRPDRPYTGDTAGVARLYEQSDNGLTLIADVTIDGRDYELEADMPRMVGRNRIYVASIIKEDADRDAQLTVEAWEDGEDTDLLPDFGGTIRVDVPRSSLPADVELSDDLRGLTLPYGGTELLLALDCGDELEMEPAAGSLLEIEPLTDIGGPEGMNRFRISKPLYAPGMPSDEVTLRFRRKGLANTYPEDMLTLRLEANPTAIEGPMSFDTDGYAFDFGRYVDNELGRFTLPQGKSMSVEFGPGEDAWVKLVEAGDDGRTIRVLGGWKPNDATADGRIQSATLVISDSADGSARETYTISRRNYGLPVTWLHGIWWCKYNARGASRDFDDQILCPSDPAAASGKSVLDYLRDCTAEEFRDLWGWAYQGDSGNGMRVVEQDGILVMEGFSTDISSHINRLPADALAPDGYELPSMEDFNRVFDATDYIWMMWSGTHRLRNPWEGHDIVKREQRRRNDIAVGGVTASDLLYVGMSSPDFAEYEPVVWYGPGAQWNADGIRHSNHYNNILFGVCSPEGSGWYMNGSMAGLYMTRNGAGNKDTRILRFKKSPVEYIYGL